MQYLRQKFGFSKYIRIMFPSFFWGGDPNRNQKPWGVTRFSSLETHSWPDCNICSLWAVWFSAGYLCMDLLVCMWYVSENLLTTVIDNPEMFQKISSDTYIQYECLRGVEWGHGFLWKDLMDARHTILSSLKVWSVLLLLASTPTCFAPAGVDPLLQNGCAASSVRENAFLETKRNVLWTSRTE